MGLKPIPEFMSERAPSGFVSERQRWIDEMGSDDDEYVLAPVVPTIKVVPDAVISQEKKGRGRPPKKVEPTVTPIVLPKEYNDPKVIVGTPVEITPTWVDAISDEAKAFLQRDPKLASGVLEWFTGSTEENAVEHVHLNVSGLKIHLAGAVVQQSEATILVNVPSYDNLQLELEEGSYVTVSVGEKATSCLFVNNFKMSKKFPFQILLFLVNSPND